MLVNKDIQAYFHRNLNSVYSLSLAKMYCFFIKIRKLTNETYGNVLPKQSFRLNLSDGAERAGRLGQGSPSRAFSVRATPSDNERTQ